MRRSLTSFGVLVAAMTTCLTMAPLAAATGGDADHPTLRQELPLIADGYSGGTCPGVPADRDGWHFILPGNTATFTKLTVTFEPGGEQVITVFGPPKDDHAYASSEPGAKLTAVEAEIDGTVKHGKFNLSHTCPASVTPTPTPSATEPTDTPTDTPTGTPSGTPTGTPSGTPSGTPTDEPSATPSAGTPTPTTSETPGATPSASESTGTGGGDLAETGSSAPVGILAAVAVALAGGGAFLVTRRRRAARQ
ncbi:LPXTG cell wall anchor domain-containing protein [Streptomyces sp. NPDC048142]|uniref:LPXTG cell wall anchor domain-containing protein n=1 Tax=Streptomyces sp. NPDC048142 TaxID=3365501 RepID=UPI003719219C